MKKLVLFFAVVVALSFAACNNAPKADASAEGQETQSQEQTTTATPDETATPDSAATAAPDSAAVQQ